MYVRLFIDSDTCFTFKTVNKALEYCKVKELGQKLILIVNGDSFGVFNPYLVGDDSIEYFGTESEALHYIGSFSGGF
jgi:hypothetical protein